MAAAGVRSRSGQPLSDGVLRAMVSRAAREESDRPAASIGAMVKSRTSSSPGSKSSRMTPAKRDSPILHQLRPDLPVTPDTVAERIRRAAKLRR